MAKTKRIGYLKVKKVLGEYVKVDWLGVRSSWSKAKYSAHRSGE